jgi:hypothetical protein
LGNYEKGGREKRRKCEGKRIKDRRKQGNCS